MKMIRDILNWYFYKKTIKENKDTAEWKKLNLRVDWVKRIYTVIDVKEISDLDEFKEFELASMVLEKSKKYNSYLSLLNLGEIISPNITKIENSDSWLIVYTFIWRWWSWKKILVILGGVAGLIAWVIYNGGLF